MTDREKLVDIINTRLAITGWITSDALVDLLIAHGVTVREMQKPLTLDEVFDKSKYVYDNVVWMEQEDEDGDMCVFPSLVSNFSAIARHGTQYLQFLAWPKQEYVQNYSDNRDYGKTWRCWAEKPTEEERKAAEWL